MSPTKSGKGLLTFGPPGTASEALAYNQGYGAGIAASNKKTRLVDAPDLVEAETGEVLIKGNETKKKRQQE